MFGCRQGCSWELFDGDLHSNCTAERNVDFLSTCLILLNLYMFALSVYKIIRVHD